MRLLAIAFALALPARALAQGDAPVTIHSADIQWREAAPGTETAPAWGDMNAGPHARFVRFAPGASHAMHTHTAGFHGLLVAGSLTNAYQGEDPVAMMPGTYWYTPGGMPHANTCVSEEPCVVFGNFTGPFDSIPVED